MENLIVAQSGGPTSTINATLCGVVKLAKELKIDKIYGAKYGIKGLLKEDLLDLNRINEHDLKCLKLTPSSVLGSCRYKLKNFEEDETEYKKILDILKKYSIKYFIYIGGNDSMDTVRKFSKYLKFKNVDDISIVGAPKTIDNDLELTDHCPGFGSAAKYVATQFKEIELDTCVYDIKAVTLVETMGRDSGWLAAASCLSRNEKDPGPSLIYCCEATFSIDRFLKDIEEKLKEKPNVLVALSEGIRNEKGDLISDTMKKKEKDMFGHSNNAGAAKFLENVVRKNLGIKTRSVELNISQRAAAHIQSAVDVEESFEVGKKAVLLAKEGKTGHMVAIKRKKQKNYEVLYSNVDLEFVANKTKKMPLDFIAKNKSDVTTKAISYLKPLIQGETKLEFNNGVPKFFRIN